MYTGYGMRTRLRPLLCAVSHAIAQVDLSRDAAVVSYSLPARWQASNAPRGGVLRSAFYREWPPPHRYGICADGHRTSRTAPWRYDPVRPCSLLQIRAADNLPGT